MNISIRDMRRHLKGVLDRASLGEELIVTRHGRAIARILPIENDARLPDLREFRDAIRIKGPPLSQDLIADRDEERF